MPISVLGLWFELYFQVLGFFSSGTPCYSIVLLALRRSYSVSSGLLWCVRGSLSGEVKVVDNPQMSLLINISFSGWGPSTLSPWAASSFSRLCAHPCHLQPALWQSFHQRQVNLRHVMYLLISNNQLFHLRDGTELHMFLVRQPGDAAQRAPTLLYFHGNAGNIGHRWKSVQLPPEISRPILLQASKCERSLLRVGLQRGAVRVPRVWQKWGKSQRGGKKTATT